MLLYTNKLCQQALHTANAFHRLAALSSVSRLQQTKGRFFTCRPFRILLLAACSWKLYFACFDVGMCLLRLKTLNSETATSQTGHFAVDPTSPKKRCFHEGWATWTFAQGVELKGAPTVLRKYCQYFLSWYVSYRRVHKIAKSDRWLRYVCSSFHLSAWKNSPTIRRIFI